MEVNNVKLDWSAILENEISYYEKVLDSSNIREMYSGIITMLDQNNLKSRVIISDNVVVAYAFLIRPNDFSDRMYAHFGFETDIAVNTTRLDTLITWARNEARSSGLLLLFNAPFNGGKCFTDYVKEKGIDVIERVEMKGSTKPSGIGSRLPDHLSLISIEMADIEEMDRSLIEAFREEREYILISKNKKDRITKWHELLEGKASGKIITSASPVLVSGGRIVAMAISTFKEGIPLISDLFVLPEYQGKGIGKYLLDHIRENLKEAFEEVSLWVDRNSHAFSFYKKNSFSQTGKDEVIYFFRLE